MKNTDVEALLNTAVSNATPDVLSSILSRCEEREGGVVELKPAARNISWIKPLCAAAAALALIVGGWFGVNGVRLSKQTEAVISLDVNPSIEIEANRNDKVLAVRGLNSDGEALLEKERAVGTELEGQKLEDAVAALVGTLVDDGYLGEYDNSVLLAVKSGNSEKSARLEQSLMTRVSSAMSEKGVDGAVIGQSLGTDERLQSTAQELGVSESKASLVSALASQDPALKPEELAKLGINDLGVLTKEREGESEAISILGSPSTRGYVSAEAAINEVCAEAKVDISGSTGASARIGVEDGRLVYDVSITIDSKPVTIAVDAATGKVISWIEKLLNGSSPSSGENSADGEKADSEENDGSEPTATTPSPVDTVGGIVDSTIDGVGGIVDSTIDGVGGIVDSTIDGVGGIVDSTIDGVGGVVDSTIDGVGGVVDTTIDSVSDIVDATLTDPSNIEDTAEDSADKIEDSAEKFVDDIKDAAKDFVDRITGSSAGSTGDSGGTGGGTGDIGSFISGIFK